MQQIVAGYAPAAEIGEVGLPQLQILRGFGQHILGILRHRADRLRHQLHQPVRARAGHCRAVEIGFDPGNRIHQRGIEPEPATRP